jgi:hypothetical protein
VFVTCVPDMNKMSWKALSVSELPVLQLTWASTKMSPACVPDGCVESTTLFEAN